MREKAKILAIALTLCLVLSSGAVGELTEKEEEFIKLLDKAQIVYLQKNFSLAKELLNKAYTFLEEGQKETQIEETKAKEEWFEVISWEGKSGKTTEPFTIKGEIWRIKWESKQDAFTVAVMRPGEEASVAMPIMLASAGEEVSYVYKSGTFYLSITALGEWDITIEEKR